VLDITTEFFEIDQKIMYESCVLLKLNYAYIMYAITITISITNTKMAPFQCPYVYNGTKWT